jgi:protein TonB
MGFRRDFDLGQRQRWAALLLAVAVHGAAVAALMLTAAERRSEAAPSVLMVQWVSDEKSTAVEPKPADPKPVVKQRALPTKVQATPLPASELAQIAVAAPAPSAAQVAEPAMSMPATTASTASAQAEPLPVVAPRFDADYLANPAPVYPAASRALGEQGKVFLRVLVTPQGEAQEVLIRTGSGFERLDVAALEAVRRWKFLPARQGEEAVAAWVIVPISFSLRRT